MSRSTQYSKQLQHIYLFRQENRFFLADLIRYQALNAGCFCVVLGEFHELIGERDTLPHFDFIKGEDQHGSRKIISYPSDPDRGIVVIARCDPLDIGTAS